MAMFRDSIEAFPARFVNGREQLVHRKESVFVFIPGLENIPGIAPGVFHRLEIIKDNLSVSVHIHDLEPVPAFRVGPVAFQANPPMRVTVIEKTRRYGRSDAAGLRSREAAYLPGDISRMRPSSRRYPRERSTHPSAMYRFKAPSPR